MLKKFTKFFTENTHSPSHLENENNELSNKDIALMEKVSRLKRNKLKNEVAILSALSAGVAGIGYLGHRLEKSDPLYRGSRMIRTTKTAGKIGAGVSLAAAGLAGYLHYKDKKDKQNSKIREYDNIKNKSFSEEEDKDYIDKLEKKKARSKITGAVTGTATTLGGGLLGYHGGSKIGAAIGKNISANTLTKAANKQWIDLEDFMHTLVKADRQVKLSARTGRIVGAGLGLATGAYLGKKHYDKKKKEIEEKIRRYKEADEDDRGLMRKGFDTIKKSKQYSEKEDKEYLNNSNKKADKSKNVQELAGAIIGGVGGRQLGIPLGDYLENKYLNINGIKKCRFEGNGSPVLNYIINMQKFPNADTSDKIISNSRKIRNCVPIASIAAGTLAGAYLGKKLYDRKKKRDEKNSKIREHDNTKK